MHRHKHLDYMIQSTFTRAVLELDKLLKSKCDIMQLPIAALMHKQHEEMRLGSNVLYMRLVQTLITDCCILVPLCLHTASWRIKMFSGQWTEKCSRHM